jgi:hypothetical protein
MLMSLQDFRNRLCILRALDMHELVDGDVIFTADNAMWADFQADPYRWFLAAEDWRVERLWRVMDARAIRKVAEPVVIAPAAFPFADLTTHPERYGMRLENSLDLSADERADRHSHTVNQEWNGS